MAKDDTQEYNKQFLPCRDFGHAWFVSEWYTRNGAMKRTLDCDCGTMRHDEMDNSMKIVRRRYVYPKGYGWKHTKIPIIEIRKMLRREGDKLIRWRK